MGSVPDAFSRRPERADRIGVPLDAAQVDTLRRHFALVLAKNEVMNLTRVTDPDEAVTKLYLASLALIPALREVGVFVEGFFRALDLGTGAGFPGIPLAVACPHMEVTLVDARRKKADFLAEAAAELGLNRVTAVHGRGAELPRSRPGFRSGFDLVTARAMASAPDTVAEAAGLLHPGGILAVFKGPGLTDEEIEAGRAAATRNGLEYRALVRPEVEDLDPRILVYSAWSSRDERAYDG